MPKRRSVFDDDPNETRNASFRRAAIAIGSLIGIGIILWGGYSLFSTKVKTETNTVTTTVNPEEDTSQGRTSQYLQNINDPRKALENVIKKDSQIITNGADSANVVRSNQLPVPATTPVATGPLKTYKFILHVTRSKDIAISMYNKLKPRVVLETADSTLFKIVINVPGTPADTTRMKDSLRFWYWGPRQDRQVRIEQ
jgi:hypothetical protein